MQRGWPREPLRPRPAGRLAVVLRLAPDRGAAGGLRRGLGNGWSGRDAGRWSSPTTSRPRQGGIQTFVAALLARRPPESLVVLASDSPGLGRVRRRAALPGRAPADRHAAAHPGDGPRGRGARPPARLRQRLLRRRRAAGAARAGAAVGRRRPPGRRDARARDRAGWPCRARRQVMQRIAGRPGRPHLHQRVHARPARAGPGAGAPGWRSCHRAWTSTGSPRTPTATTVRRRHGLGDAPVVVCVSRLVARKGQDVLVAGWPRVLARHPRRAAAARRRGPGRGVAAPGGRPARGLGDSRRPHRAVAGAELPAHYAAGDVFAMPCRTRRAGLDVEGLGMVFLEAAACGRPVVAGTSGGAPEAVREGVTGHVVDPRSPDGGGRRDRRPARRPGRARAMGAAGRAWVEERWSWTTIAATFDRPARPEALSPAPRVRDGAQRQLGVGLSGRRAPRPRRRTPS